MEMLNIPICDLDLPGIKSEKKLEEHIAQLLNKEGWDVKRQVSHNGSKIDILATKQNKKIGIEVKFNNFGKTMRNAVGQTKWYQKIYETKTYLAFPCYDLAQLTNQEIQFLKDLEINIVGVREDALFFADFNEINQVRQKMCTSHDKFQGYRNIKMKNNRFLY